MSKRAGPVLNVSMGFLLLAAVGCSSAKKDDAPAAAPPQADAGGSAKGEATPAKPEIVQEVSLPKDSANAKYKTIGQALRAGRANQVHEEATRILGASPNDPTALNVLAMLYLKREQFQAAKALLARAIEKNAPSASLHNNLGVVLLAEGETDAAAAEFKKALRLDDRHVEANGNLGSIYAKGGDFERAHSMLEIAYDANKSNVKIANNYALSLRARKDYEGANKVYERAYKEHSNDLAIVLNYAILLIDYMNKPKEGLDLVYKAKFLEPKKKDVLARVNALEKKAKSELK